MNSTTGFNLRHIAARVAARRRAALPPPVIAGKEPLTFERLESFTFEQFCGLLKIIDKSGKLVRLEMNEVQRAYEQRRTARDQVLKGRQTGGTTIVCARDLYEFLTRRGSRVVVVCQSSQENNASKQLAAIFKRFFDSLVELGLKLEFGTDTATEWTLLERDSSLRILTAGASQASAEKKGRAGTITRLHLTETAFYEFADATLNALEECVPDVRHGSSIVSESTPNGASGYFYSKCQAAQRGVGEYKFHFFPWYLSSEYQTPLATGEVIHPHADERVRDKEAFLRKQGCTAAQIKWWRAKVDNKGLDLVDQEYPSDPETCFLVAGRAFFDRAIISTLIGQVQSPLEVRDRDRIRIYQRPQRGRRYLIAADTSEGGGGDPSGALVYDYESAEHVATIDGQYLPHELAAAIAELGLEYNGALAVVERNKDGVAVLQALSREQRYANIYVFRDKKQGWPTTSITRPVTLNGLDDAIRKGLWKSPDRAMLNQLRTFVVADDGKPQASNGEHDDLVMAAAIGWEVRQLANVDYRLSSGGSRQSLAR